MRLALPIVLVAFAPSAAADVWTVDDFGPANFSSIQPAIDAASDGDVILVRNGAYEGFTIADKDLALIGTGTASNTQINGGSLIVGLASARSAVLANLTLRAAPGVHALSIESCDGAVRMYGCALVGFSPSTQCTSGTDGLIITAGNDVVLTNCAATGGTGSGGGGFSPIYGYYGCSGAGGRAISVLATSIALYDVTCTGGNAGTVMQDYSLTTSARGGDGFDGGGSFLFASKSPMVGGRGAGFSVSTNVCNWGAWFEEQGRGGNGCSFASANVSDAWFVIPMLTPGTYGPTNCSYVMYEWPPAKPFVRGPPGSTAMRIAGIDRPTLVPALLTATTSAPATFMGFPGELVDVVISPAPDFVWSPAMKGVWSVDVSAALPPSPVGVVDALGQLVTTIPFPPLAAGEPNRTWYVQPVFTGASATLGSPTTVTLVP